MIGQHMVDFRGGSRHGTHEILPGNHPLHEFVSPVITIREMMIDETGWPAPFPDLHVEVYRPATETFPGHWQYIYYGLRCPHENNDNNT